MRIGIDVRYLSHGLVGGVHNYVTHFVPALVSQARDHQIFLYADTKKPFELSDLPQNVTVRYLPWRGGLSSIRHDWSMREIMAQDHLDIAHFPANYGFGPKDARTVITLHDEINLMPWLEIVRGHPKNPRTDRVNDLSPSLFEDSPEERQFDPDGVRVFSLPDCSLRPL